MKVRLTEIIAPSFYQLHHEFKADTYDEYWLKGGRGSTKSTFASAEILYGMLRDPNANAVVFRRYKTDLRDTVYGQFEWAANKMGIAHLLKFQVSPMQIIFVQTGQRIVFRGADDPKKTRSINLGRGYVKFAWFEECDQYAGMEDIRNLLQSLFRGEDKHRVAIFSYNPPKSARSWVNQEARTPKPGRRVHHSDYRSVPRHWLGERFLTEAEHLRETNETAYRHEYLGEEVGTGLEVFTNVTLEAITDEQISTFDRIRQGLDFGYAIDPLAFERLHYDSTRRRIYLFGEISGLNISNRVFAERAKPYGGIEIIADSAEPKSIDEIRTHGLRIRGAKKGPGSVDHGIKWLQDLEAIIIDPQRCSLAAKQFINYALETDKQGNVKSRYPDKDDDSIDATRYALEDDMTSRKVRATRSLY